MEKNSGHKFSFVDTPSIFTIAAIESFANI